jgi:hypothetical protein
MVLLLGAGLQAQTWEAGVLGGGSVSKTVTATSPAGTADVGFKSGVAAGAYIGGNMYKFIGGELRYEYLAGDLKAKGSGAEESFSGYAHAIHYDFLVHFAPTGAKIRPFVAAGGGVKIFLGTGSPSVSQPLDRIVLLTHTHETKGLGSVGAGLKAAVSKRAQVRLEVHDFITPFPRQVIAPAAGGKISGLLHDIVFMGGIAITF